MHSLLTILAILGAADVIIDTGQPDILLDTGQPDIVLTPLVGNQVLWVPLISTWTHSATIATDRSATDATCTATGTPPTIGGALNGTSDYFGCGDEAVFTMASGGSDLPFFVSAWVNLVDATQCPIVAKGFPTLAGSEWIFYTGATDLLGFIVEDDSVANGWFGKLSSIAMTSYQGLWTHVAATYDGGGYNGGSPGIVLYINGSAVAMAPQAGAGAGSYVAMEDGTEPLQIGKGNAGSPWYCEGAIEDVRVGRSKILTPAEIEESYAQGRPQ